MSRPSCCWTRQSLRVSGPASLLWARDRLPLLENRDEDFRLLDLNREVGFFGEMGLCRIRHAFRPDMESAAPATGLGWSRRNLPDAPDALAFVEAGVEHIMSAE